MSTDRLSRRERQIMDILFRKGECSAREVLEAMADAPSYSAVRALLAKLVDKGVAGYRQQGKRYLYAPTQDPASARMSALRHLVSTFFDNSPAQAANALLGMRGDRLEADELAELKTLVDRLEREADHD